jgi:hypothetical protein
VSNTTLNEALHASDFSSLGPRSHLGVTLFDAADCSPMPCAFSAGTLNV